MERDRTATVYIYKLVDPITEMVRYVGQTKNPDKRLKEHLWIRGTYRDQRRTQWIDSLITQGLKPRMVILQEARSEDAERIEQQWIDYYTKHGHPLLNIQKNTTWQR
jgi:hypothetical protein